MRMIMNLMKNVFRCTLNSRSYNTKQDNELKEFLMNYVSKNQSQTKICLNDLVNQLDTNKNRILPYILPYEHHRQKDFNLHSDLTKGIVTIAHVLPSENQVVLATGFGILDGRMIVTCAHTFYQVARYFSSVRFNKMSQSIAITHQGDLISIEKVESHLVQSDLVVLRLEDKHKITALPVDPYPAPKATELLSYDFSTTSMTTNTIPNISFSWKSAQVLFYKDRCGKEAETGTYDELSSMMYSHSPSTGSSGGPVLHRDTLSVVAIIRGNEMTYDKQKLIGFAVPSECLFEAFKLPGIPD